MQYTDPRTLKRVNMATIEMNDKGEDACDVYLLLFAYKLKSYYGIVPPPETAIDDDLNLYFFWDCGDDPVVITLDPTMWDYVKDPLVK